MSAEPRQAKCADCGYLAVRHYDTRQLLDAEKDLRTKGELPQVRDSRAFLLYDEWPICFVQAINFREELKDNSGVAHRKQVLNEPRLCAKFTDWRQGLTPKQHWEMEVESARRVADERERQRQRDWEAGETTKREQAETRRHWQGIVITAIVALVAAGIGAWATFATIQSTAPPAAKQISPSQVAR